DRRDDLRRGRVGDDLRRRRGLVRGLGAAARPRPPARARAAASGGLAARARVRLSLRRVRAVALDHDRDVLPGGDGRLRGLPGAAPEADRGLMERRRGLVRADLLAPGTWHGDRLDRPRPDVPDPPPRTADLLAL